MRLHADFAERGTANSVHGMNAEGDVVDCLWAAESTRIAGARGQTKCIHEKAICIATINPHGVGGIIVDACL